MGNPLFFNRCEIPYKLAVLYKQQNKIKDAEILVDIILDKKKPNSYTVIEDYLYEFFIPLLYIEIKLLLNKKTEAIKVIKNQLIKYPNNQQLLNIKYYLFSLDISSIKLSDDKTIVIHMGNTVKYWNPKNLLNNKMISGSEIMAINLAKEFVKFNYRVILFGSFENKEKNINYECFLDSIEYIDYKYFSEFALKYIIDYLIISRHTSNLCYYNNIRNVYKTTAGKGLGLP